MPRTAILWAASSEILFSEYIFRTVSAKTPPPGTISTLYCLKTFITCSASESRLPPTLTTIMIKGLFSTLFKDNVKIGGLITFLRIIIMTSHLGSEKTAPTVLIVEDDSESAELLKVLFERHGFNVTAIASNGARAVEKYKEQRPDVVTMDILMPTVDGRDCTKQIMDFDSDANIVVVSVLGQDELETLKTLGVKAFIKKPLDIKELFETMVNISVSIVKNESGSELGAVGMASPAEADVAESSLFLDILRHDILNPLGLIKNFAELMLDTVSDDNKSQVEAIIRSSERLIEIIEDGSKLTAYSKLRRLSFERLEAGALIEDAVKANSEIAARKNITIENRFSGEHFISANILLSEAFSQIISNAVKYSPEGSTVIVDAEFNDSAVFSFTDSGPGVDDQYKTSIFNRFEQAKKMGVKGCGIGLAVVKKITGLHGGKAWVEDNPEGGSVFKISIPIRDGKETISR
ncbi:MAG TPA: hybrid sensor histidine kinase/response regulator [Euryarchaeota archaeon]|nr:hybrid sensor histidine kinase/response regulator [Euryarchaeota archaeon]